MGNTESSDIAADPAAAQSSTVNPPSAEPPQPPPVSESSDASHESEAHTLSLTEAQLSFAHERAAAISDEMSLDPTIDGMYAAHMARTQKLISQRQSSDNRGPLIEEPALEERMTLHQRASKRVSEAVQENTKALCPDDEFWAELRRRRDYIRCCERRIKELEGHIADVKEKCRKIRLERERERINAGPSN
jgi:hypothetical protein